MLAESYLFFVDVKFLDVEYHLLLETALVWLSLELCKTAQNFFSDRFYALFLKCLNLRRILENVCNLLGYILVKDIALLGAERIDVGESLVT